jgi:dTDP-4-dehydrorhamnose 3,5-epimerase
VSRFEFRRTSLPGLLVVERQQHQDSRGFLSRLYCAEEFAAAGAARSIVQINQTLTRRQGTVRGLHFQHPPHAEMKLVSCLRGEVFDVAVDLRRGSPTFLHWHGERLSPENRRSLLIPEGFAHGMQALADDTELIYLHSAPYHGPAEGALHPLDPRLAVAWPAAVTDLSDRDRSHPMLTPAFAGIEL